ncbi:MAG: polysaccharide pyruvyl transferase family protein [Actinobacteria bacterium]|nr:polysaccharide pyruvyl transferase family protein [Actinomycetota bacterium]
MIDYASTLRRRARAMRRVVYASAQQAMWRRGRVVPAFWWDGHPNFGDDMTPWLLPHYGVIPIFRAAESATFAGVGSILEFLPSSFAGVIWGSGLMEEREHPLPDARLLAVRGPLTAELIGARDPVTFGDPGLLVRRVLPRPRVCRQVAIVPHGHHRAHEGLRRLVRQAGDRVRVVNVHQGAGSAVREIAASSVVFTTSLHGLITADAYGIPVVWTSLEPSLTGGDFKFRDYEAVMTPGSSRFIDADADLSVDDIVRHARAVDAARVDEVCRGLERALALLTESTDPLPPFPRGVLDVVRR